MKYAAKEYLKDPNCKRNGTESGNSEQKQELITLIKPVVLHHLVVTLV